MGRRVEGGDSCRARCKLTLSRCSLRNLQIDFCNLYNSYFHISYVYFHATAMGAISTLNIFHSTKTQYRYCAQEYMMSSHYHHIIIFTWVVEACDMRGDVTVYCCSPAPVTPACDCTSWGSNSVRGDFLNQKIFYCLKKTPAGELDGPH